MFNSLFKAARMLRNNRMVTEKARKIITIQQPSNVTCLRQRAIPLSLPFGKEVEDIIQQMVEALKAKGGGAGLAAPQIGINKRIIICSVTRKIEDLEPMINPEYEPDSSVCEQGWEGCFSVPLIFGKIARWQAIKTCYYTPQGDKIEKMLQGLAARIYQHEYDHLEGTLIIDKTDALKTFKREEDYKNFLKILREEQSPSFNTGGGKSNLLKEKC